MSKYLRRSAMAVSLVAVALAFAPLARAQQPAEKKANMTQNYGGTIESIDTAAGTVTVKNPNGETKTLTCDDVSKLRVDTKWSAALSDLKVGDEASVTYTESDGKLLCESLSAHKPAPPAPKQEEVKAEQPVVQPVYRTYVGIAKSIDMATRTVTMRNDYYGQQPPYETYTFTCDPACKFEMGHGTLSDVKVGYAFVARCTVENGKSVCYDLAYRVMTH